MKKLIAILLIAALTLSLAGCASGEPSQQGSGSTPPSQGSQNAPSGAVDGKTAKDFKIAMVSKVSNPYMDVLHTGAEEKAKELGLDNFYLVWCDTGTSIEQQISIMSDISTQGYDAIILLPLSGELATSAANAIKDGIALVNGDNLLDADVLKSLEIEDIPVFIGADNYNSAYMVGKAVAEKIGGKGEVGILAGPPSNPIAMQRVDGFRAAFDEYPDIKIVSEQNAEGNAELGLTMTTNMLTANPNISAIVAMNDESCIGALQAAEAAGYKDGDIIFGGIDADEQFLKYIKEGKAFCTIYQNQGAQGAKMVEVCYDILNGKTYESGEQIMVPTILVTPETVDEYLK